MGIRPAFCVLRISLWTYILHKVGTGSLGEGLRRLVGDWHTGWRKDREVSELRTQRSRGTNEADSPYPGWAPRKWRFR